MKRLVPGIVAGLAALALPLAAEAQGGFFGGAGGVAAQLLAQGEREEAEWHYWDGAWGWYDFTDKSKLDIFEGSNQFSFVSPVIGRELLRNSGMLISDSGGIKSTNSLIGCLYSASGNWYELVDACWILVVCEFCPRVNCGTFGVELGTNRFSRASISLYPFGYECDDDYYHAEPGIFLKSFGDRCDGTWTPMNEGVPERIVLSLQLRNIENVQTEFVVRMNGTNVINMRREGTRSKHRASLTPYPSTGNHQVYKEYLIFDHVPEDLERIEAALMEKYGITPAQ